MRRTVCIVSPGNLASNPRVLKEADALHGAGYDVTAVVCDYNAALRQADDDIEAAAPWTVIRADDKKSARLALIRDLLARLDYDGKRKKLLTQRGDVAFLFDAKSKSTPALAR